MDDTQRIVKCGNLLLHTSGGFFKVSSSSTSAPSRNHWAEKKFVTNRHQLHLQKRWPSKYLVLYDGSKSGIKRLELFDSEIKFKKQNPAKIIALVDCVRVVTCQRHKSTYTFEVSASAFPASSTTGEFIFQSIISCKRESDEKLPFKRSPGHRAVANASAASLQLVQRSTDASTISLFQPRPGQAQMEVVMPIEKSQLNLNYAMLLSSWLLCDLFELSKIVLSAGRSRPTTIRALAADPASVSASLFPYLWPNRPTYFG